MTMQDLIRWHLLRRSWLSYLLYPMSLIWWALVVRRRQAAEEQAYCSPVRIISVGNLVSGGSGKTPFTIMLAGLMRRHGIAVAVSHRDYQGAYENNPCLISGREGLYPEARNAGDEARLIAQELLGVPVVCGRARRTAIKLLVTRHPDLEAVILDDSFQHVRVKHDLDFVLFSSVTGIGNGFVLPAGFLREPLTVLNDRHVAVITSPEGESRAAVDRLRQRLKRHTCNILECVVRAKQVQNGQGQVINLEALQMAGVALVSAIGSPETFERSVTALGMKFERHFRFPDHYGYKDEGVITMLADYCAGNSIGYLLTTDKDWVKLRDRISRLPGLCRLQVRIEASLPEDQLLKLAIGR